MEKGQGKGEVLSVRGGGLIVQAFKVDLVNMRYCCSYITAIKTVVFGGILIYIIIILIANSFRSGPASTTAAPVTVVEHSPTPVSFKVDPAEHFRRFSGDFIGKLRDLPPVAVYHTEVDSTLLDLDYTLARMQEQIRNVERVYDRMQAEERERKTELSYVDGRRFLATPGEHLKNMRASYEQQKKLKVGNTVSTRSMMEKFHWSATYEMDARKTDSILTPYVGTITIQGTWYSGETTNGYPENYRFMFAAQDGKWILRSIARASSDNSWKDVETKKARGGYFEPLMAPAVQSP